MLRLGVEAVPLSCLVCLVVTFRLHFNEFDISVSSSEYNCSPPLARSQTTLTFLFFSIFKWVDGSSVPLREKEYSVSPLRENNSTGTEFSRQDEPIGPLTLELTHAASMDSCMYRFLFCGLSC